MAYDYETMFNRIKSEMNGTDVVQIGKVYVLAPSDTVKEHYCNGAYLGKFAPHSDYWVMYGTSGGPRSLTKHLYDLVYDPNRNPKLVVKKIIAELADDPTINTSRKKPKTSKKRAVNHTWHQFVEDGHRFITDGYTTYCKASYDNLVELLAECEGRRLPYSFTKWAEDVAGDFYSELNHNYFYVHDQECYDDPDHNITVYDFGPSSSFRVDDDTYDKLGAKIALRVLEIRHKYNID